MEGITTAVVLINYLEIKKQRCSFLVMVVLQISLSISLAKLNDLYLQLKLVTINIAIITI